MIQRNADLGPPAKMREIQALLGNTMLLNSRELIAYTATAKDGAVGSVRDLLIDDETWRVRYIVVDTNGFLTHNDVLLSPRLVEDVQHPDDVILCAMSKAELEAGILASSAPPVSVHHNDPDVLRGSEHDPHLRSAAEIGEYVVSARDGELGRARGLVVETATWFVRYLVVDTGEFLGSKQVLLTPSAICEIDWSVRKFSVELSVADVLACPEYDRESEITRQYESFLHDYYGWQPYWQES